MPYEVVLLRYRTRPDGLHAPVPMCSVTVVGPIEEAILEGQQLVRSARQEHRNDIFQYRVKHCVTPSAASQSSVLLGKW